MSQNTPRELWREIFTTMRDDGDDDWQDLSKESQHQRRSTLVPLLLTCRYFRNIAEPLLYEHIVLYVNKGDSRSGTVVDALKAREERRGWVKTVVATRRPTKDRDDGLPTEESILIETALAFIPGLQGLRLFRTLISDEIYRWVLTHPTLRTLILQRCDFTQKGRHKIDLTQSNVTRLTLSQSSPFLKFPFGEVTKLFALRRLEEFTVTVPFFNHIATLVSALPAPALHDLRRLSIELPAGSTSHRDRRGFAVQLFPFLQHSPNLTHLLMQPGVTVPPSGIFPSRLEHLKVLQAPAEVVAALRTGAKGLDTLTMNGILQLNIAPTFGGTIRHLTLDIGTDVVAASVLACPNLLSLTLRLRPENGATGLIAMPHAISVLIWVQTRAAQDLATLSSLKHLSLQLNPEIEHHRSAMGTVLKNTEKREKKVLTNFQRTLPSLTEVRLPSDRLWKLFDLVALAVQVGAFTYLKGRLHRVYSPRSFLPPPEKRAEKLPSGPWKWFIALVTTPTKEIIRKNGLDAYLFIRFLRLLIFIFGCFTVITWPILITVNTVGIPDNAGRDGLSRLSWGNIPTNMQIRYVAHIIVAYILTFLVIWVIRRELATFIKLRHQFLISRSHSKLAQSKTVLITNLPDSIQSEQDLLKMLTFVPGGISKVWIYRQTGELPDLFDERNKVCKQLEKAEVTLLRDAIKAKREKEKARQDAERQSKKMAAKVAKERKGSEETTAAIELIQADVEKNERNRVSVAFGKVVRPTHRLGWVPFRGERVDTITWCKEEIVRLTEQIDKARKDLRKDQSHGAAFVQCNLQLGANILSQVIVSDEPLRMYDKWTDVAPDDIVWRNIDDSGYETRARYVISWLAMLGLIILWTFPVAFVGLLSNVSSLCAKIHWLAWICRLSNLPQGIIQGILPPVFLAILFLILPWILRGLAWYENIPRWSLISLSVYKRYYVFLVVHGFLVVTLSSGLTASIPKILSNPGSVIEDLSTRLPDASTFFLTYTVTAGLTGAASALLQLASLVLYFVHRWLFGDTPRQTYQKTWVMPTADFGVILPRISLIATIGIAYSVIAPVINGLALLAAFLLWVAWKYLFTWVFDQPDAGETGGLYYPLALGNLFVGLYIEQICLAGLFFLATDSQGRRSSIAQGVMMVILLAITLASHVLFVHSYGPLTRNLPTVLSTKKIQDRWERKQRGDHQILPDLFNRERVSKLVRRKLKIETKPVDTAAIIAEEKRKEAEQMEEKEQKVKENMHDLEMLKAVANSSFVNGARDTPPAEKTLEQAVSSSVDPNIGTSGSMTTTQPAPSKQQPSVSTPGDTGPKEHSYPPNTDAPLSRQSTSGSNAPPGSKGKSPATADATPAVTLRPGFDNETKDNSDDEEEDDIEDWAFNHPSTYKPTPIIWIPKDDLGLSALLVEELTKAGVSASDAEATIDEKGIVQVFRSPPDEEWAGGHDR